MSERIQSHGSPVVTPSELIDLIIHCYHRRIPLMVWGIPGIGKSACFYTAGERIANELGKKFGVYPWTQPSDDHFVVHDIRMTLRNPVDIRGTPWPDYANNTTRWLPTEELPRCGYGIIFFDDMPTAEPACQKAAFRLFLQRSLDNYILPDGYWVAAAGNRMEHGAGAFMVLTPLRTRWINVELVADSDDWLNWATQHDIDGRIIAFIAKRPDMLCKFDPKSKHDTFPLPRTWEFASKLIKDVPTEKKERLQLLVGSAVGLGAAIEFMAFIDLMLSFDIDEILKNPETTPLPKQVDQIYALSGALMEKARNEKNLRAVLIVLKRLFNIMPEFSALVGKFLIN